MLDIVDDLLDLLPAGGLPAVLAAVLIALAMLLMHLRARRRRDPLATVVPTSKRSRDRGRSKR